MYLFVSGMVEKGLSEIDSNKPKGRPFECGMEKPYKSFDKV